MTLLFFGNLQQKSYIMHFQSDNLYRDPLSINDSKFQDYETSTNLYLPEESTNLHLFKDLEETALQTFTETPKKTQNMEVDDNRLSSRFENEINGITQRFIKIKRILIDHSVKQSDLHEHIYDFKQMKIDWEQISPDFTNKISIVQDLRHLVELAQKQSSCQIKEALETKFQEYYLERHYGGLRCEIKDLSIQQKGDESIREVEFIANQSNGSCKFQLPHSLSQSLEYINLKDEKGAISKIGGYIGLGNQSKLTYTQQFCQTIQDDFSISVEVPKIIEVEIPIIIYRVKQKVITYDESDLQVPYNDIDQIIDKYSRPYEQLYLDSGKQIKELMIQEKNQSNFRSIENQSIPIQSINNYQQIGSIMLDSHLYEKETTQVDLTYSLMPEEQILMDSFAPIGSLISNHPESWIEQARQDGTTLIITQKVNSRSILQKFEESQRALNEENLELKQMIGQLRLDLEQSEKKRRQLSLANDRLSNRLEQQIQQGIVLTKKLDEFNLQLLQQKIKSLTSLNECKQKKLVLITQELKQKSTQLEITRNELQEMIIIGQKTQQELTKRQEQAVLLLKQLQQREEQLRQINSTQQDIIKIVSETELSLKGEIQKLQGEKNEMRQRLNELQRRVENDGISLQYDEARQIQGIIESREHQYSIQIKQISFKYQQTICQMKREIEQLRQQIKILHEIGQTKSQLTCTTLKQKKTFQNYIPQFQAIINQYDQQLQSKDQQILQLKKIQNISKFYVNSSEDFEEFIESASKAVERLMRQLGKERQQRMKITQRLLFMESEGMKNQKVMEEDKELEQYEALIQKMSKSIEDLSRQNCQLKQNIQNNIDLIDKLSCGNQRDQVSSLNQQIARLRKANSKLKRYTQQIEQDLLSVSGINRCEIHKHVVSKLIQQRNYFAEWCKN